MVDMHFLRRVHTGVTSQFMLVNASFLAIRIKAESQIFVSFSIVSTEVVSCRDWQALSP
jgi:hypothetical protein